MWLGFTYNFSAGMKIGIALKLKNVTPILEHQRTNLQNSVNNIELPLKQSFDIIYATKKTIKKIKTILLPILSQGGLFDPSLVFFWAENSRMKIKKKALTLLKHKWVIYGSHKRNIKLKHGVPLICSKPTSSFVADVGSFGLNTNLFSICKHQRIFKNNIEQTESDTQNININIHP